MEKENLTREQLLELVEELEIELKKEKAKSKSRKNNKRGNIKTTPEEIIDYWEQVEDESVLSVDWAEAEKRCWICGNKRKLQRCHIIPDSLQGKDEASNLVLLCERCHREAPNVESKTFMWDWIKAHRATFYDTYDDLKARREYEFIYKKTVMQEFRDRDILSSRDFEQFWGLRIGRSSKHFGQEAENIATKVGLFRMRLEEYDKKYSNKKPKTLAFRMKEVKFDKIVQIICKIAKEYKCNVWEGRSKNPFSVTISAFLKQDKKIVVSIKLCRGNKYKACLNNEYEPNPNNNKASDYTIEIGDTEDAVEQFVREQIEAFSNLHGLPEKRKYAFTINPKLRFWYENQ